MPVFEDPKSTGNPRSLRWFFRAVIFVITLSLLIMSPEYLNRMLARENLLIAHSLSPATAAQIDRQASTCYNNVFVSSGLAATLNGLVKSSRAALGGLDNPKLKSKALVVVEWFEERVLVFALEAFLFMQRLALLFMWLPFIIILLGEGIYCGVLKRRIKQSGYEFSSPTMHRGAIQTLSILFLGLPALMLTPFQLNPVILPFIFLGVSLMLSMAIGNLAKRI